VSKRKRFKLLSLNSLN